MLKDKICVHIYQRCLSKKKLQIEFNITEDNFDIYYNLLGIKSNKYVET